MLNRAILLALRHPLLSSLAALEPQRRSCQRGRCAQLGEVAALAQLWDAQLDRPGAGLPDAVTVAIAVIDTVRAALAVRGTRRFTSQAEARIAIFRLHRGVVQSRPFRFAPDSPLEGAGFEPSVPRRGAVGAFAA
jgi:hypothetical protein